jgi:sphinganine-1-phosphate aldolase
LQTLAADRHHCHSFAMASLLSFFDSRRRLPVVQRLEDVIAISALVFAGWRVISAVRRNGGVLPSLTHLVLSAARRIPGGAAQIDAVLEGALQPMVDAIAPIDQTAISTLPEKGVPREALCALLADMAARDYAAAFSTGRSFGGIYHAPTGALVEVQNAAFSAFNCTNALYPATFGSVRKMEAEVVAMVVSLLHPPPGACGLLTSGGTESILLAIKAYRDAAMARSGSAAVAQMLVLAPITAHPALDKACAYFGVGLVKLPVDPLTQQLTPATLQRALSPKVICVYASAPTFSHGAVDPIPDIGAICAAAGIPVHVDNCLGGVLYSVAVAEGLTYISRSGGAAGEAKPLPPFDFSVPGVTSVSIDVHKYGNAPKGASVVAFRSSELRAYCYSTVSNWPGGLYATPTMTGSRGGASIAAAWATLRFSGWSGYRAMARKTHALHQRLASAIAEVPGLALLGEPALSVVSFAAAPGSGLDIYALGARLTEAGGWHLNSLQHPPGLHVCVSERFEDCMEAFLADLNACASAWRADPRCPRYAGQGTAGIYGAAGVLPAGEVDGILRKYCDILTVVRGPAAAAQATVPSSPA